MPPPSEAPDAVSCTDTPSATDVDALVADAEEEAARAEARAKAARAHAARLRQEARQGAPQEVDVSSDEAKPSPAESTRPRRRRLRRPRPKAAAFGVAILLICASLGASGYLEWKHRTIVHERQRAAEFAQAARQAVVTLMSISADHATEDLQRVIDDSTGEFKNQLEVTARNIADGIEQSKVSTRVTVAAVAVQSMTDNSAVVLVAAKSDASNADNTKRQPANWRLRINLNREGGQLKMSKVEFV